MPYFQENRFRKTSIPCVPHISRIENRFSPTEDLLESFKLGQNSKFCVFFHIRNTTNVAKFNKIWPNFTQLKNLPQILEFLGNPLA